MRRLLLPALLLTTTLPAQAQERSLWELVHPDRILGQIIRSGILGLRSQMDVRYSDLTTSVIDGRLSADDLSVTLYDNITGGAPCDLSAAGIEVFLGDPLEMDLIEVTVAVRSLRLEAGCLPTEANPVLAMMGLTEVVVPEVTVDLTYDMPSAAATMRVATAVEGVGAVQAAVDMAYVTFWAGDGAEPTLNVDLSVATLTAEDLGGWSRVRPFLPAPFTDPDTAGAAATQLLGRMFAGMTDGTPLPKPAKAFIAEAAQGWGEFVAAPGRLVMETGFAPTEPQSLTPEDFDGDPIDLIERLRPVVDRMPAAERDALPADLVARALDTPAELTSDERRRVGLALLRGTGAPRAVGAGTALLQESALDGDGDVALAMARALRRTDPEAAYAAALTAGGTGVAGLRRVLDDIEADLPFATRLRLQAGAAADPSPGDLRATPRELATRAEAHFGGVSAPRSLRHAMLYATFAAARGDGGAARLMDRIGRSVPADGRALWSRIEAEVSETALAAWVADGR